MKREIKFRAWEPDTQKMVDVFGINPMVQKVYLSRQQLLGEAGDDLLLSYMPDEDHSYVRLMQYTNLKDRNGVNIYEGDVVAVEGYNHEIVFEDGGFIAVGHGNGLNSQIGDIAHIAKILGNVYENLELLEKQ